MTGGFSFASVVRSAALQRPANTAIAISRCGCCSHAMNPKAFQCSSPHRKHVADVRCGQHPLMQRAVAGDIGRQQPRQQEGSSRTEPGSSGCGMLALGRARWRFPLTECTDRFCIFNDESIASVPTPGRWQTAERWWLGSKNSRFFKIYRVR